MAKKDEINKIDKRLTRIEVLLTNHLEHVKEDITEMRQVLKELGDNLKNVDFRVYRNTVLILLSVILLSQSEKALALLKGLL